MGVLQSPSLKKIVLCLLILFQVTSYAENQNTLVAVASNFNHTAKQLQLDFYKKTGNSIKLVSGSTGKLYAQIINGAPYDLYLAADQRRPQLLQQKLSNHKYKPFTYAIGTLTLWNPKANFKGQWKDSLINNKNIQIVAIANPKLAPYGAAAQEVLKNLKQNNLSQKKIVLAENISQVFHFIKIGQADLGFISMAHMYAIPKTHQKDQCIKVPSHLYSPLYQDGLLLSDNIIASAFVDYLQTDGAKLIMSNSGYTNPK